MAELFLHEARLSCRVQADRWRTGTSGLNSSGRMATVQIWAWLILLSPLCSARNVSESTLLSQVATMMSHDAATGYIGVCPVLCSYYQTQTVGFPEQMDCGVRAFDLRLKLVDGTWRYYHPAEGHS